MEELLRDAGVERHEVRVTVAREGRTSTYASASEAGAALPSADLANLDNISLNGGGWSDLHIVVYFFKHKTMLKVEGTGGHHIQVAGIADDLEADIDRGSRDWPHEIWILGLVWSILVLMEAGAAAASSSGHDGLGDGLRIATLVWAVVAVGITFGRRIVVPPREIIADSGESRASRWGHPLLRFGAWVLTLMVGAVLGALVQSWWP